MSGAERSLLDLIDSLPAEVDPVVAAPEGDLADLLRDRGVDFRPIPGTDVSFRPHPVHTTRGLAWMAGTARRIRRLASAERAEIVHANSTRAGLAAGLAARGADWPLVNHVRDWVPAGLPGRLTLRAIDRGADVVIANSRDIAREIPSSDGGAGVRVVHNGIDISRFDPGAVDRAEVRRQLDLDEGSLVISTIAQFVPWKAQDDAVRILAALKDRYPQLRLLVAGTATFTAASTRFDSAGFERGVHDLARELGVAEEARFLGQRDDVPEILAASDLLLVPSWREAFGRIVIEGMAMGLPVIATSAGGPAEIISDGADGFLLAPQSSERWAEKADELLGEPELRAEIGRAARKTVEASFTSERHAAAVVSIYAELMAGRPSHGQ
jgi:glycosyltransferase involved in cell wall biosynthesis